MAPALDGFGRLPNPNLVMRSMVELSTKVEQARGSVPVEPTGRSSTRRLPDRLGALAAWVADHPVVVVVALALGAAVWAVVGSRAVFPYLSDDHDEALYLLQADSLAHGHLFPPAPKHPDAFLPWLSVFSDGRYVLKYTPVHASILAVGMLMGSARWSLGLIAAGVVLLSYALAKEVLGDRKVAALASAFLGLSPLFLLQSTTFLPYTSSLLLLEAFALALLRGTRSNRRLLLSTSGLLFGVAAFARPFDAVLFAVPLGLYFVVSQRSDKQRLLANTGWFALGAVLPLVVMLSYYRAATGSAFRSPFTVLEPRDTLGFGTRKLSPTHPDVIFTPERGWYGVSRHILLTTFWGFGGLTLIGLFLVGMVRRPRGPQTWLALGAVTFSCGYLFFWGTYGTGLRGSLTAFLGPFYFLPVLIPVTLLAAKGFAGLWRRDRALATLAFATMAVTSGYVLVRAVQVNLRLTGDDRRLYAPVVNAELDRSLVLLPPMWGTHLLHPFAWLRNSPDYDGKIVYALDRGDPANLALLRDFPGRVPYRFRVHGHYRANPPDRGLAPSLERLGVSERRALQALVSFANPTPQPYVVLSVTLEGVRHSFLLDTRSSAAHRYEGTLSIGPHRVDFTGPVQARQAATVVGDGSILVSVSVGSATGDQWRTVYERRFAYTLEHGSLRLLLPGTVSMTELGEPDPLTVLPGP